ncbi:DNRLRE domain-containing protein, partial [candidate division KSB1 bacterium]|nr:DNRLRE domain-containing protein [candidate division KSB1 bacterium]
PDNGPVGTEVTIHGDHLNNVNAISFNESSVSSFTIDSETQIRASVPAEATTGPISLTNVAGTSQSSEDFSVLLIPEIASFSPANGPVATEVTIDGGNFTGTTVVAFNGTQASEFTVESDSRLRATVPAGATDGKVSVTNADGTGESADDFIVIQPPTVSSFSPTSGPFATEVTLAGTGFDGTTDVAFNGTSSTSFSVDSDTQIRAEVPSDATTGPISVTNSAGPGSSSSDFTITFIPSITSFTPVDGPVGTQVTINGVNFTGTSEVTFNGALAANVTVKSDSLIVAEVPSHATTGKLSVTNGDGTGQSDVDFTVVHGPSISSFSPDSGTPGTEVTISGGDFAAVADVAFNGTSAQNFVVDSETQIRADVPSDATSGPISVTNVAGVDSSADDFTVTSPPSVLTFTPIQDSFIRTAKPTNNYGDNDEMRVREPSAGPVISYLKFDVSGISGTISSAKLRLRVVDESDEGGSAYSVSNNYKDTSEPWVEDGLVVDNAPEITGSPLSSLGNVNYSETVEFDVTLAISADGIYSFAIANSSNDVAKYSSKEGSQVPELVVEVNTDSLSAKMANLQSDALEEEKHTPNEAGELVPENIALLPNYPNPFNIETTIQYTLPKDSHVQLLVFNVKGQEVRKLVDKDQTAGIKKIRWNGLNDAGNEVSSGLYFIRLKVGSKVLSRKTTLQK